MNDKAEWKTNTSLQLQYMYMMPRFYNFFRASKIWKPLGMWDSPVSGSDDQNLKTTFHMDRLFQPLISHPVNMINIRWSCELKKKSLP